MLSTAPPPRTRRPMHAAGRADPRAPSLPAILAHRAAALARHARSATARARRAALPALLALLLPLAACGDAASQSDPPGSEPSAASTAPRADAPGDRAARTAPSDASATSTSPPRAAPRDADAAPRPVATVAVLGDSIAAGYHLDAEQSFPALLAARLADDGLPVDLINAGVSGDTSAGGLRRVDWLLAQDPDVLVVELGGNDGLRGQPLDEVRANLAAIIERAQAAGAVPVLLGMALPPNLGPQYTSGFRALYDDLADEHDLAYVPFFMEPVAGRSELNLGDGLHPNAAGHELLAERVYPTLREVVRGVARR